MVVEDSGGISPVSSTYGIALLSRNLVALFVVPQLSLERDQLVALSTGASREALLAERRSKSKVVRWRKTWRGDTGALLPRGVFAQSRN